MTFVGGYTVFLPGFWDIPTFFFSYTMIGVFPILYLSWKFLKKTKTVKANEVDLLRDVEEIEEYNRNYVPRPPRYVFSISALLADSSLGSLMSVFSGMLSLSTLTRYSVETMVLRTQNREAYIKICSRIPGWLSGIETLLSRVRRYSTT